MTKERRDKISQAIALLEEARDAEQSAFDNLPASFQSGEKGQAMEAAVSNLDEAISSAQSAIDGE